MKASLNKTSLNKIVLVAFTLMMTVACSHSAFDAGTPKAGAIPSMEKSSMRVSGPNFADGMSPAYITISLMNIDGAPVAGQALSISVMGGTDNVLVQCTVTDANGLSSCQLYSTSAGWKNITVVGAITMNNSTEFMKVRPFQSTFAVVTSGDVAVAATGEKITSTSGITEDPTVLVDGSSVVRAKTSILGSILQ